MEIHRLLTPELVRVDLPGRTKREVLDNLIDLLDGQPQVRDLTEIRQAVMDREKVMSTGVGKGLALPHAKTPAVTDTVAAFAICRHAVDFGAIDNQPVQILFLLVGTEEAKSAHIKLLSRVSRLMNRDSFRGQLLHATSSNEVMELFEQGEAELI